MAPVKKVRAKKTQMSKRNLIYNKTPNDILCGRGIPIVNYHGNIRLHQIVDKYREQYLNCARMNKQTMLKAIVKEVKEGGARFLKRSEEEAAWEEVSEDYALAKVGHALRCKKAMLREESNRSMPLSESQDGAKVEQDGTTIDRPQDDELRDAFNPSSSPGISLIPILPSVLASIPRASSFPPTSELFLRHAHLLRQKTIVASDALWGAQLSFELLEIDRRLSNQVFSRPPGDLHGLSTSLYGPPPLTNLGLSSVLPLNAPSVSKYRLPRGDSHTQALRARDELVHMLGSSTNTSLLGRLSL